MDVKHPEGDVFFCSDGDCAGAYGGLSEGDTCPDCREGLMQFAYTHKNEPEPAPVTWGWLVQEADLKALTRLEAARMPLMPLPTLTGLKVIESPHLPPGTVLLADPVKLREFLDLKLPVLNKVKPDDEEG